MHYTLNGVEIDGLPFRLPSKSSRAYSFQVAVDGRTIWQSAELGAKNRRLSIQLDENACTFNCPPSARLEVALSERHGAAAPEILGTTAMPVNDWLDGTSHPIHPSDTVVFNLKTKMRVTLRIAQSDRPAHQRTSPEPVAEQGVIPSPPEIATISMLDTPDPSVNTTSERIPDISPAARLDVQQIPYIPETGYQPDKCCLPGTRTALLDQITEWADNVDPDTPRVFLLLGPAGTGKSSIGHTIAGRFSRLGSLGSAFCFSRNEARTRKPASVLRNIARDLASNYPTFRHALAKSIEDDSEACGTKDLNIQFERFILRPARALRSNSNIFFLIDALDESGTVEERRKLLLLIRRRFAELPSTWRVLITAREEGDISAAFGVARHVQVQRMPTVTEDSSLRDDILLYIRHSLRNEHTSGLIGDLSDDNCKALAKKSEGIFQWSFVTCQYIKQSSSSQDTSLRRCQRILEEMDTGLDTLYHFVLSKVIEAPDDIAYDATKEEDDPQGICCVILGFLVNAYEPLSKRSLRSLLSYLPDRPSVDVDHFLRAFGSLLSGIHEEEYAIRPLHSSFTELLCSPERGQRFYVGGADPHAGLAISSLSLLKGSLHFNMGHFPTSYISNQEHIAGAASTPLIQGDMMYACKHWGYHTAKCIPALKERWTLLRDLVRHLLIENLLYWIEAGSTGGATANLEACLCQALQSLPRLDDESKDIAQEAIRFIRRFAPVLNESSPHLYVSALVWCPFDTRLAHLYGRSKGHVSRISAGRVAYWPRLELSISGHTAAVESVTFSQDGTRIVSGSEDRTTRVWNAITWEALSRTAVSHHDRVTSVVFSPDGTRIASASWDNTIRLWNATTGEALSDPLTGHTNVVSSVVFSPDGSCVASGSWDKTIRVWNATTGEVLSEPMTGHTGPVNSVALSPDGTRLVSGAFDHTVRLWDMTTRKATGRVITCHTSAVTSVAFSANGIHIVFGSVDATIRVVNSSTGEQVGEPMIGHKNSVTSVAFSPDGMRIASGSHDCTVRLWNATTREAMGEPVTGHTNYVTAVAFSPDGTRIISGSVDKTIRIWSATTETSMSEHMPGHTEQVESVAFSPDGTRIVSGSSDNTVRVWNASTGEAIGEPMTGHTKRVYSVAFSSDGKRIVSGSFDKTVRVCNATTGELVCGPMTGHTNRVTSAVFSSDGTRIVSSSHDETVQVWNAISGDAVGKRITGHGTAVECVIFSPDGTRVISGAADSTVRVWNATTGEAVGKPMTGHTLCVTSVAFSPDGTRIISGSDDGQIRVWNATTREAIGKLSLGHTSESTSIAFSPNGVYIVSGSTNATVRVWNVNTGEAVSEPMTGHTNAVTSVAFSPDGTHIVSGSTDKTVRVLKMNIISRKVLGRPVDAPFNLVNSPHGVRITPRAGAEGNTIRYARNPSTPEARVTMDMSTSVSNGSQETSGSLSSGSQAESDNDEGAEHVSADNLSLPYLTLSPHPEHQMQQVYLAPNGSKAGRITFNPHTGWILGNGEDRLFWVPPDMMGRLYNGERELVIGGPTIHVDMSQFAHGTRWTEAFNPPSIS